MVTKALQLHPREASLWIHASAWEFEHNRNAGAARALMQRGLRMCPGSADLWAEYFRMELLYAHTLRTRRKILGIASAGAASHKLFRYTPNTHVLVNCAAICTREICS